MGREKKVAGNKVLNGRAVEMPEWLKSRLHWADTYRLLVEERNRLLAENEVLKAESNGSAR